MPPAATVPLLPLLAQHPTGFREQTKGWPAQPVDQAIRWLRGRPPGWVVADLGCGDAKIAATVQQASGCLGLADSRKCKCILCPVQLLLGKPAHFLRGSFCHVACCNALLLAWSNGTNQPASHTHSLSKQTVHSFDLVATAPGVIACNMAALPLPDASADAAIFCPSRAAPASGSSLQSAARLPTPGGWRWIARVQSGFAAAGGGDGGGGGGGGSSVLPAFLAALGTLGFAVRRKDTSNSHFLVLELQRQDKGGGGSGGKQRQPAWPPLRPCQYKKR